MYTSTSSEKETSSYPYHNIIVYLSLTDTTNQFVELSFDIASKTFICTFPSQQPNALKWCNISYGLPQVGMTECYNRNSKFLANTSTSDSVYLTESGAFESGGEHCFTATAGNDSFSVIVEGTFDAGE